MNTTELIVACAAHPWGATSVLIGDYAKGQIKVESISATVLGLANGQTGLARRCMRKALRAAHRQARLGF